MSRPEPDPASEHEEDSYDEDMHDPRRGRGGAVSRRSEKSWARDRSASRERSLSPRSDRRSVASSQPAKPTKVTLVKSRKNEGIFHQLVHFHGKSLKLILMRGDLAFAAFVLVSCCCTSTATAGFRSHLFSPLNCLF